MVTADSQRWLSQLRRSVLELREWPPPYICQRVYELLKRNVERLPGVTKSAQTLENKEEVVSDARPLGIVRDRLVARRRVGIRISLLLLTGLQRRQDGNGSE